MIRAIISVFVGSLPLQPTAAILSGQVVTPGTKTYATGVRTSRDGDSFCGGALISPTHVLTTAICAHDDLSFAVVGAHYRKGTKDGEAIKVTSVDKHPNFDEMSLANNFAILTLEKSSKFAPVKLPKADDSDISAGMEAISMGWGITTNSLLAAVSNEMRSDAVEVWSNDDCKEALQLDNLSDSVVCAGGVDGKGVCRGDVGGPLVIESGSGDSADILVGLANGGSQMCGKRGIPATYARVSAAIPWINVLVAREQVC